MSRFFSKRLSSLSAYVPGEQPSDVQYIKLNTNESPFPPPDAILSVVEKEAGKLNLYPSTDGPGLINKLAQLYGVKTENVILGNGSDELLAFTFHAFFETGVIFPDITYGFYPVYAKLYDVPFLEIPLCEDLTINVNDYINTGKNIIIANPNAPTGIALSLDDIEKITQSNPDNLVAVDEAYVDFGAKSAVQLTHKYDNLLIIHTFSKSRSMAGARLGFAVGSKHIIDDLGNMKYSFNPYNVNRLTQIIGETAILEEEYFVKKRSEIIATREHVETKLMELGFSMTNSTANFIFCKHPDKNGYDLYSGLKEKGILIRHWSKPRISDYVRITIGTKEQMDAVIKAIEEIIK